MSKHDGHTGAHTPGPWYWDSDPVKGDPANRLRYQVTTIGKTVTQCYYGSDDPHAEADARLIAAAPDLLEAARLGLSEAEGWIKDQLDGTSSFADAMKALDPIRAALAKATGETK